MDIKSLNKMLEKYSSTIDAYGAGDNNADIILESTINQTIATLNRVFENYKKYQASLETKDESLAKWINDQLTIVLSAAAKAEIYLNSATRK